MKRQSYANDFLLFFVFIDQHAADCTGFVYRVIVYFFFFTFYFFLTECSFDISMSKRLAVRYRNSNIYHMGIKYGNNESKISKNSDFTIPDTPSASSGTFYLLIFRNLFSKFCARAPPWHVFSMFDDNSLAYFIIERK